MRFWKSAPYDWIGGTGLGTSASDPMKMHKNFQHFPQFLCILYNKKFLKNFCAKCTMAFCTNFNPHFLFLHLRWRIPHSHRNPRQGSQVYTYRLSRQGRGSLYRTLSTSSFYSSPLLYLYYNIAFRICQ